MRRHPAAGPLRGATAHNNTMHDDLKFSSQEDYRAFAVVKSNKVANT
ncbi:MAG: hypothetical protein INR71_05385 [Terriglobus roseus]|nr:hypothetical protein [Terriglobus roseus]